MSRYIGIDLSRPDRPAAVLRSGHAALIPGIAPLPAGAQTNHLIQAHMRVARTCPGQPLQGAVLAVPNCYTAVDRSAILDGAKAQGLEPVRLLSCPAAIGLGYLNEHPDAKGVYASVQIRGAACEVALLELGAPVAEVLAIASDENAMSVTRGDELSPGAVDNMRALLKRTLADAGLSAGQLQGFFPVCDGRYLPSLTRVMGRITARRPAPGADPADAIAKGAAVLGGVLDGESWLLSLDVTTFSLGVETLGGVCIRLIGRNTTIPARKSMIFSTAVDNQSSVEVHVLQGESEQAAQNKSLGRFMMSGIAPAPKGKPQIEVTFDIDANGIVTVTARDVTDGKTQPLTVTTRMGAQPTPQRQAPPQPRQQAQPRQPTQPRPTQPQRQAPPPPQEPPRQEPPRQAPPPKAAAESGKDGRMDAVLKLLPVYDSLARAVQFETDLAKRQGAEAILNQYRSILAEMGVQPIQTVGRTFDPRLHDAQGHINDPRYGAGEIVLELEAGFIMDGKVIRFAKVQVAN